MDPQRKLNSIQSTQPKSSPPVQNANSQGVATLIVMLAVLTIIILFCCFAAPGIRGMCKRYIFRTCTVDDPEIDNVYTRRYGYDTRDEIKEVSELKKKLAESQRKHPQQ